MTPRLLSCTTARPVQRALRALRPCRGPVPWVRDSSPPHPPDTKIPTRYYCCRALPDSSVAAHTLAHWEIGRVPHCAAILSMATRSRYCARRSSRLAGAPPATLLSLRTAAAVASSRAILWRRAQSKQSKQSRALSFPAPASKQGAIVSRILWGADATLKSGTDTLAMARWRCAAVSSFSSLLSGRRI